MGLAFPFFRTGAQVPADCAVGLFGSRLESWGHAKPSTHFVDKGALQAGEGNDLRLKKESHVAIGE